MARRTSRGASGSFAGGTGATGGVGYVPMHHWYYYPSGSRLPIVGTTAPATGSLTAPSTGGSSSSSGVVRGGFGSTASGSVGE